MGKQDDLRQVEKRFIPINVKLNERYARRR